jgi:5'-nucleotidase
VSDWHAQLDPLTVNGVSIGGAAVLSTYWQADRAAYPNTLTLTAGDAFGAAPPLSAFFNEEPAVKAMNLMGFDIDTFGNHNFDKGVNHLQQMIDLAEFSYVSANLRNLRANLKDVAPYQIIRTGGIPVAIIGLTNPEAPTLLFPGSLNTLEITDPVAAANNARADARRQGARIFVVITHMGITGADPTGAPIGPLIDFANAVTGFDVILGDHTDVLYSGEINGALVIENRSKGLTYARTRLTIDSRTSQILSRTSEFVTPLSSAVTPDPAIEAMLAPYRAELAVQFDTVMGVATDIFVRGGNVERSGEVPIGNLVADAIRLRYGTQLALTNGGGIRQPLPSSYLPMDLSLRRTTPGYAPGPPYDLVIGDAFAVLPFGNVVVTRMVSGAQLYAALEHGVGAIDSSGFGTNGRFPQISGFRFTFHYLNPVGSRVTAVSLADGTPILPDGTLYSFATNDFVNAGGDGYTMLADGQGSTREVMFDVLVDYITGLGTITPTVDGRIDKQP